MTTYKKIESKRGLAADAAKMTEKAKIAESFTTPMNSGRWNGNLKTGLI